MPNHKRRAPDAQAAGLGHRRKGIPLRFRRFASPSRVLPTAGACLGLYGIYRSGMTSFIKSVTFDCQQPLRVATFWAAALGSNVDEDSTADRAWVEPAGWGGPSLWFVRVPELKTAKNRQHFDLRPIADRAAERDRLIALGASVVYEYDELTVMADPEGNEFCLE